METEFRYIVIAAFATDYALELVYTLIFLSGKNLRFKNALSICSAAYCQRCFFSGAVDKLF